MLDDNIEDVEIQLLLEGIFQVYGYDFRNYKLSTIRRRIQHRLSVAGFDCVSRLQASILHEPQMMRQLFQDFTIGVTEMFRDPGFFQALRRLVFPRLSQKPTFRIWHAGCSSGEEVYSLAILLKEEGLYDRARIYATDINEHYLNQARQGFFPLNKMKNYTQNYQKAGGKQGFSLYYVTDQSIAAFRSDLRENIVFAQHNLVTDQSFNEFDLIVCRNVLIYFNESLQDRVLELFYNSLGPGGNLTLGNKEGLAFTKRASMYTELSGTQKIYQKMR